MTEINTLLYYALQRDCLYVGTETRPVNLRITYYWSSAARGKYDNYDENTTSPLRIAFLPALPWSPHGAVVPACLPLRSGSYISFPDYACILHVALKYIPFH